MTGGADDAAARRVARWARARAARRRVRAAESARRRARQAADYRARVLAACRALVARDLPPTLGRIRAELGGGATVRISAARRALVRAGELDPDRLDDLTHAAYSAAQRRRWAARRVSGASATARG